MAQTTSATLQAAFAHSVQKQALQNLRARLFFGDPSLSQKGVFNSASDTLMFVSYDDLPINTTPLTEGTNPTPRALAQNVVTIDCAQYGDAVELTDIAKLLAPVDLAQVAAERIARQAAESIDKVSRDTIALSGTAYFHSGVALNVRSDVASGDKMTSAELQRLRAKMFSAKIPMPSDGLYRLIVHPNVGYDLRADTTAPGGWLDVNRYSKPDTIMKGEIGTAHGFRIMEAVNAPTFSSTTTVYASIAYGDIKPWGSGDLQTLRTFHVAAGGDHSDILALKEDFGWKCMFGVGALSNAYYFRMESAATAL